MKLLSSVGGASGPLYGTLFIRASAAVGARTELSLEEWLACLEEGIDTRRHDRTHRSALIRQAPLRLCRSAIRN